jgi:hypothetical protein
MSVEIADLDSAAALDGNELIALYQDGVPVSITTDDLKNNNLLTVPSRLVTSPSVNTPNIVNNVSINSIDAAADTCVIGGGGRLTTAPQKIGSATKPVGAAGHNSDPAASVDAVKGTPWSNDAGYPSGAADVATIAGGYDNIVNTIAGTIGGGGHNFIPYNSGGHAAIFAGSNNYNESQHGFIGAGEDNTIRSNVKGVIGGGSGNTIKSSNNSVIVGGIGNTINTSGANAFIGGGTSNSITGTVSYEFIGCGNINTVTSIHGTIVNGASCTVSGNYSFIGSGDNCQVTANYSGIFGGSNIIVSHIGASAFGHDARSVSPSSLTHSAGKLVNDGDAQNIIVHQKIRTTNATATNMGAFGAAFIELDDTKKTVVGGRVMVVGIREDTGASAAFYIDFQAYWDGTTNVIYDSSGSGSSRSMTAVNSAQATAAGITTAPTLEGNTGAIRAKVTGIAATNIKWSAIFTATMAVV